ncbi:hypothetical protein VU08_05440 [Desulfobulbus sp. F5]|nr:hypothetical protein [Desulfobulbus sp. F5]
MPIVTCSVEETYLENDYGNEIEGIIVTCNKCGHEVESFGTSQASINRCFVLLREECPEGENNYYVDEDEIDEP